MKYLKPLYSDVTALTGPIDPVKDPGRPAAPSAALALLIDEFVM